MKNYAGRNDVDNELAEELTLAGITVEKLPELMRDKMGEVKSIVIGTLHGWDFKRFWYYWVCNGPGIEVETAEKLHEQHGSVVRTAGMAGGVSPREWFGGFACGHYHVDTQEGLNALAATIRSVAEAKGPKNG